MEGGGWNLEPETLRRPEGWGLDQELVLEGSGRAGFLLGLTFGSRILFGVKKSEVLKTGPGVRIRI